MQKTKDAKEKGEGKGNRQMSFLRGAKDGKPPENKPPPKRTLKAWE